MTKIIKNFQKNLNTPEERGRFSFLPMLCFYNLIYNATSVYGDYKISTFQ